MKTKPTIRVVFRAERGGDQEVTAVFDDPDMEPSPARWAACYAHVGQHGDCSQEWYRHTRPATRAEYALLLREIRQVYSDCRLIVARRVVHR